MALMLFQQHSQAAGIRRPRWDVGGHYKTKGRAWIAKPTTAALATCFKPGGWNKMIVSTKGGHINVRIHAKVSAGLPADGGLKEGRPALQVHARQAMDVWFRNLEITGP